MFNARNATAALLAFSITFSAQAGTLHVPEPYPTIQAAINAAVSGDIVLVADGTYTGFGNRDIDFGGNAITVSSENGPGACIIDCQGTDEDPHRAFYFHYDETNFSVLEGFTIKNGWMPPDDDTGRGGAVYCVASSPLIKSCRFDHNSTARGAAIYANNCAGLTVVDCTFSENTAGVNGGALFVFYSNVSLADCTFSENSAGVGGGAVFNWATGSHTYSNCTFIRNSTHHPTTNGGGGINAGGNDGVTPGTETLTNCRFIGNSTDHLGGGVWFRGAQATVTNCTFDGNIATSTAGGGGVAASATAQVTLINCRFTANRTGDLRPGAALWVGDGLGGPAFATVVNCTFSQNLAPAGGGGLLVTQNSHADVANSVLWGDTPTRIALTEAATITVSYSDVQGGWPGTGNINADPLFVRNPSPGLDGTWGTPDDDYGDLRLTAGSPCIDAGDPAFHPAPCEHDLAGACRAWDGNADTVVRVDMGASEFAAPRGDLNGDCEIGLSDLTTLLAHFGTPTGATYPDGDLDGDADVDLSDLTILLSNFGSTCP